LLLPDRTSAFFIHSAKSYQKFWFLKKFSSFCVDSIPESLLFLSQDDIVESIIKCLWACDPENKELIPSYKLPTHMTNKYKVATTIANAIKVGLFSKCQSAQKKVVVFVDIMKIHEKRSIFCFKLNSESMSVKTKKLELSLYSNWRLECKCNSEK
jgi:hypothetical protein